mmetsp:Transcript_56266/g.180642  ORF Transcript_56266/g.180642 Transcript_56266/m.180642 type:complete len:221 (-) Transcript_56266:529-1191(-)
MVGHQATAIEYKGLARDRAKHHPLLDLREKEHDPQRPHDVHDETQEPEVEGEGRTRGHQERAVEQQERAHGLLLRLEGLALRLHVRGVGLHPGPVQVRPPDPGAPEPRPAAAEEAEGHVLRAVLGHEAVRVAAAPQPLALHRGGDVAVAVVARPHAVLRPCLLAQEADVPRMAHGAHLLEGHGRHAADVDQHEDADPVQQPAQGVRGDPQLPRPPPHAAP